MKKNAEQWKEKAILIAKYTSPGETIVAKTIGALGYFTQLEILDQHGLVHRGVAESEPSRELRSPGHDKVKEWDFFLPETPIYLDAYYFRKLPRKEVVQRAIKKWESQKVPEGYAPVLFEDPAGEAILLLKKTGR